MCSHVLGEIRSMCRVFQSLGHGTSRIARRSVGALVPAVSTLQARRNPPTSEALDPPEAGERARPQSVLPCDYAWTFLPQPVHGDVDNLVHKYSLLADDPGHPDGLATQLVDGVLRDVFLRDGLDHHLDDFLHDLRRKSLSKDLLRNALRDAFAGDLALPQSKLHACQRLLQR